MTKRKMLTTGEGARQSASMQKRMGLIFRAGHALFLLVLFYLPHESWAQAKNSEANPFWVQVDDSEQESSHRPTSLSQHFGFVFQEDQIKVSSRLPYGQSLIIGGLRYESNIPESFWRYQITMMLGESSVGNEYSNQFSIVLPIQTRYFGFELGAKRLWNFSPKFRLGPEIRVRTQLTYQFSPQSQLPSSESIESVLGFDLNAQYLIAETFGVEFELGYDQFFESQLRVGVFRKW
jgi:hypothetical protein